jgi:hypothetical protein
MPFDGKNLNPDALRLMKALEILRTKGWCQNRVKDEYGSVCIGGAINETYYDAVLGHVGQKTRSLLKRCGVSVYDLVDFNDDPERTFQEIEAWFEEQIAKMT